MENQVVVQVAFVETMHFQEAALLHLKQLEVLYSRRIVGWMGARAFSLDHAGRSNGEVSSLNRFVDAVPMNQGIRNTA